MSERMAFIQACLDRREPIVTICERFNVSEKTGQKWLQRFREEGPEGLRDRSHAPQHHAGRITPEVRERILALRRKYPLYGAAKLRDWLVQHEPEQRWPAASSIGALLTQAQLIRSRRRTRRSAEHAALDPGQRTSATAPNVVWTADFKGQFRLGGGGPYCYPLTVMDLHSRFLLGCTALETTAVASTRRIFTRLFRDHGLPEVLRTDNGIPFAHPNALGRLGELAFWWVRLGIRPEHITPARPAENGAHERFHKTLKAATTQPAADSLPAQQRRFDAFRTEYNTERPHASLPDHHPPARLYTPAPRAYPSRLPALVYPDTADVRRVDGIGYIKWQNTKIFLSGSLAGDDVGLTATDVDEEVVIAYGALELGTFNQAQRHFTPRVRWTRTISPTE